MCDKSATQIGYVVSDDLLYQTDRIPCVRQRASMVHTLIEAYDLLKLMHLIPAYPAVVDDLLDFHSGEYVQTLIATGKSNDKAGNDHRASCCDDNCIVESGDSDGSDACDSCDEEFGLGFDCPPVPDLLQLSLTVAGGSLAAAAALCAGTCRVALNWCGGWHHAQRHAASGFCYVNDIVLAISRLLASHERVLYVDLDVHHGDGVQQAFYYSRRVLTVSVHHCGVGFFPATGHWSEVGAGRGRGYALNIPLAEGADDGTLLRVVDAICERVLPAFRPSALVVQCGADCLAGDPLGVFGATAAGVARCVTRLVVQTLPHVPTLVLGGGGYHAANVARCWTHITAALLDVPLAEDVPDNRFFTRYGPSFEVNTDSGTRRNLNTEQYMEELEQCIDQRAAALQQSLEPSCVADS